MEWKLRNFLHFFFHFGRNLDFSFSSFNSSRKKKEKKKISSTIILIFPPPPTLSVLNYPFKTLCLFIKLLLFSSLSYHYGLIFILLFALTFIHSCIVYGKT